MKYQYKFVILILCYFCIRTAYSREIILIENMATHQEGQNLELILTNKFNIPKELIELRQNIKNCQLHTDAVLHLCLKKDGDLEIRKINEFIVKNSLSIFFNEKKESKLNENK